MPKKFNSITENYINNINLSHDKERNDLLQKLYETQSELTQAKSVYSDKVRSMQQEMNEIKSKSLSLIKE